MPPARQRRRRRERCHVPREKVAKRSSASRPQPARRADARLPPLADFYTDDAVYSYQGSRRRMVQVPPEKRSGASCSIAIWLLSRLDLPVRVVAIDGNRLVTLAEPPGSTRGRLADPVSRHVGLESREGKFR